MDFLDKTTIAEIVDAHSSFELVSAKSTDSVAKVLKSLEQHRITSVPIEDPNGQLIGSVDVVSHF
jgi:CBS domain-containing protein